MGVSRVVNNIGVGLVEATFYNLTTTGSAATQQPFTEAMLDADEVAACLINSNEIGYLTTTYPLFGAVVGLSEDEHSGNSQPAKATVQISGVASIQGTTGTVAPRTTRTDKPCGHTGLAALFTTTNIGRYVQTRGICINTWDTQRMDILF